MIEHEIVAEEDDGPSAERNSEDEFGIFGFLEDVFLLDKIKKHVIIIREVWEKQWEKKKELGWAAFF